jgi:hypothetical protein
VWCWGNVGSEEEVLICQLRRSEVLIPVCQLRQSEGRFIANKFSKIEREEGRGFQGRGYRVYKLSLCH